MTFAPKYAIVTASDSGIGKATAVALAERGMDIGITWHTDSDGAEDDRGGGAQPGAQGVRRPAGHGRPAEVRSGDRPAGRRARRLDVFVNNAGTGGAELLVDTDYDEWRRIDVHQPGRGLRLPAPGRPADGQGGSGRPADRGHQRARAPAAGRIRAVRRGQARARRADEDLRAGARAVRHHRQLPGAGGDRHPDDRADRRRPAHGEAAGHPARPAGRRPGDGRGDRLPGRPGVELRDRGVLVADGGMLQMGPQAGSHLESDDWRTP